MPAGGFIHHSYANRVGRGTHRAVARYERLRGRHRRVLRGDVFRYFPAIDHAILKATSGGASDARGRWRRSTAARSSGTVVRAHAGAGAGSGGLTGPCRVLRGGSWNNNPRNLRSVARNRNTTGNRNDNAGFRVASTL